LTNVKTYDTIVESNKGVFVQQGQSTNIVKLEKRQRPQNTWVRYSHELMKRKDLTANAKAVYTFMLDRYMFFNGLGKEYFENMQEIADALGMQRRTVGDSIKTLEELGMLRVFKKKVYATERSVISHSYHVRDLYGIYFNKPEPELPVSDTPF
jgi:hypothetical protein